MKIASIVSSNSHIDYIGRVIDSTDDGDEIPRASDYCFGQFVSVEGDGEDVIGIIYDSRLINPEYGSFAPRSGQRAELARHNADYAKEQGKMFHGIPPKIVGVGQPVTKIDRDQIVRFHRNANGNVQLHYYTQVVSNARQFAIPLLDSIIDQLCAGCTEGEMQSLQVLKRSLTWQGTFGGMKL
jgi:hypothetical protein